SKTNYIASFAGFAPVNDPALSIVVVMDSPAYRFHYGTQASAPVFQELAQNVLEYLGVPHDMPLKPAKLFAQQRKTALDNTGGDSQPQVDLSALFAEVNHLPADDPLRSSQSQSTSAEAEEARAYLQPSSDAPPAAPGEKQDREGPSDGSASSALSESAGSIPSAQTKDISAKSSPSFDAASSAPVTVGAGAPVTVPGFVGKPMRDVVVTAASLGLNVRVYGSGVASAQAPVAGTRVPEGTTVVVRFHP
ncbi:MAG: PASTA domain-containing protein, partial [Acidobacteriaceae bacterium]